MAKKQLKAINLLHHSTGGGTLVLMGNNFAGYTLVRNFPKSWKKKPVVSMFSAKDIVRAIKTYNETMESMKENLFEGVRTNVIEDATV